MWSLAGILLLVGSCLRDHSGLPIWRVGQWVRYDVTSHDRNWQLEYALVGEEKNGGSKLFWLEARKLDQNDSLFVKCLVPSGLDGPAEKVVVGGNGLKSLLTLDGSHLPRTGLNKTAHMGPEMKPAVTEDLHTPAGSFSSVRYEHPTGQIWLNSGVPVFGIVRSKKEGVEMVLVAYGLRGATSKLEKAPEAETIIY